MPVTERMALRRTNWPDVDDLVALNADRDVMSGHSDGLPMSAARVLAEEMPRLMAHNNRTDQLGYWVARDSATGGFLGWFAAVPVPHPDSTVELDYRLRRNAWGEGLELEGTLAMIAMARSAGMKTVTATTMAADVAGHEVMEAAGLHRLPSAPAGPEMATPALTEYVLDLSVTTT